MKKPLAWSAVMLMALAGAALAQTPPSDLDSALKKLTAPAKADAKAPAPAQTPSQAPAAQPKATPPAAALPKAAAPAVAQPSPPASQPATAAAAPAQTAAAAEPEDDLPRGAPRDDYQFVAWCEGVLSTHMELYGHVKPELDAISSRWDTVDEDAKNYSAQQIAGRNALALFRRALAATEQATTRNIVADRAVATRAGIDRWSELGTVDARNQALSWMMWELPERCERVAHQLEERSLLMAPLLRSNLAPAPTLSPPRPVIPPPVASAPATTAKP